MKKPIACLCAAIIFTFHFVQAVSADELSDLKTQVKVMQRQVEMMQQKIEKLEAEKAKTETTVMEKRLSSLENKLESRNPIWTDRVKLKGSLWEYYINQDSSYFGKTSSHFLETTVRIGAEAKITEGISTDIQLIAQNAAGDAKDLTGVTTDDWIVEAELANITFSNIFNKPFTITAGRQNLEYGDGFLIYDGVSDPRAVWSAPLRSFYTIKGVYTAGPVELDGFIAMPDRDFKSYETFLIDGTTYSGRRNLYGTNLHLESQKKGVFDFGTFFKKDNSELQSNTLAISQRGSQTFEFWPKSNILPQFILEGEMVEEFGRTKVKNYSLTASKQNRSAFGGHLDCRLLFTKIKFSPQMKVCYVYLPGDNPHTDKNEAFDPMFYGFREWGKWCMGTINSFSLFNYNERVGMIEMGISPTATTSLKWQYFYLTLDRQISDNAGKNWSHELNVIFDYFPNDWFFCGAEFGYAHPLKAAKVYAGDDQDTTEFILWAGVKF